MFGISIYASPQHFIALALGLWDHTERALQQLRTLLVRTKNPPISAIYTYQLLQQKNWEEYGLDIVRFLSQLSDLSEGGSMSSSLQRAMTEGSFLTEIRHNLAHKVKISDYLIEISRGIIVKELRGSYWEENWRKFVGTYNVDLGNVKEEYVRIYGIELEQDKIDEIKKHTREVTSEWLKNESTNYEFKQFFPRFYAENSTKLTISLMNQLGAHKKAIATSHLIHKLCRHRDDQDICQVLIEVFKKEKMAFFNENLVYRGLKKLTYCHYLGLCPKVIQFLPKEILQKLSEQWEKVEKGLKDKNPKATLYKKFKAQQYLHH